MAIKLTESSLRQNRIVYDIDPADDEARQDLRNTHLHASIVTDGLLDFEYILSPSGFDRLSEESQQEVDEKFKSSKIPTQSREFAQKMYEERYRIAHHDKRFAKAEKIAARAKDIVSGKEDHWSGLIKGKIFGNLIDAARKAEGAQIYEPAQVLNRIRVEGEDTWKHGQNALLHTTPKSAPPLSAPKPDLYIAFPILKKMPNRSAFYRDDTFQNFTVDILAKLEEEQSGGLISNPIKSLDTLSQIKEKHLVCFPSTIIEIKHHDVPTAEINKCYCQAANASSTALSIISGLLRPKKDLDLRELRPVVAFTFIGFETRVWICYVSGVSLIDDKNWKTEQKYNMRCIWKGDLGVTWHALQLCRIIENLYYWTVRHFRPWVSSCIDNWRAGLHIPEIDGDVEHDSDEEEDDSNEEEYDSDEEEDDSDEEEDDGDEEEDDSDEEEDDGDEEEDDGDEEEDDGDEKDDHSDEEATGYRSLISSLPHRYKPNNWYR